MEVSAAVLERLLRKEKLPNGPGLNPPFLLATEPGAAVPFGGAAQLRYQVFVDSLKVLADSVTNQLLLRLAFSRSYFDVTTTVSIPAPAGLGGRLQVGGLGGMIDIRVPLSMVDAGPIGPGGPEGAHTAYRLAALLSRASVDSPAWDELSVAKLNKHVPDTDKYIAYLLRGVLEDWLQKQQPPQFGEVFYESTSTSMDFTTVIQRPRVEVLDHPARVRVHTLYTSPSAAEIGPDPIVTDRADAVAIAFSDVGFNNCLRRRIIYNLAQSEVRESYRQILSLLEYPGGPPPTPEGVIFGSDFPGAAPQPKPAKTEQEKRFEAKLSEYMARPERAEDIRKAMPAPVGTGEIVRAVRAGGVPDFDFHIRTLDLTLGHGVIEGLISGYGDVLTARVDVTMHFTARLGLIRDDNGTHVKLTELKLAEPSIEVDLGLIGIAVSVLAWAVRPVLGVLVAAFLGELVGALAEELSRERLNTEARRATSGKHETGLPADIRATGVDLTPSRLVLHAAWDVPVTPSELVQEAVIELKTRTHDKMTAKKDADLWLSCMGILGLLKGNFDGEGTKVRYSLKRQWSTMRASLAAVNLPHPLTVRWSLGVTYPPRTGGYRHGVAPTMALTPGDNVVTAWVRLPEPPLWGKEAERSFSVPFDVTQDDEPTLAGTADLASAKLILPPDAASALVGVEAIVTDGAGREWRAFAYEEIANEWISFGAYQQVVDHETTQCAKSREQLVDQESGTLESMDEVVEGVLDMVWNPPDGETRQSVLEKVHDSAFIAEMLEVERGPSGVRVDAQAHVEVDRLARVAAAAERARKVAVKFRLR